MSDKMFLYRDDDIIGKYSDHIYVIENYGITARAFILLRHRELIQTKRLRNVYIAESWAQTYINTRVRT